ncbi:MAG: T9SS type A sorting domain-containing protein, partial [Candidatus Delongbacteria bacterium]|nr:T9SS type A sorting domain-containing protein [Candidatus Delongbacteria bacterium]
QGQVVIYNWQTGQRMQLNTPSGREGYQPIWSPDGSHLLVPTVEGSLALINPAKPSSSTLMPGISPYWTGSDCFRYLEIKYDPEMRPVQSRLMEYRLGQSQSRIIQEYSDPMILKIRPTRNHEMLMIDTDHGCYLESRENPTRLNRVIINPAFVRSISESSLRPSIRKTVHDSNDVFIAEFDSIYFNQVYDINPIKSGIGSGCCGAASSIMGLIYYKVLTPWPTTCNSPYTHVSPYGNYITEIYRLNGVDYNISYNRNGTVGYGMYGWIYRNYLEDTKGHMRNLIRNHGLNSDTDWSPTFEKLIHEVDNRCPTVVLNLLTTSGHYILSVGYVKDKKIGIYNDPYGNRNLESYLNYESSRMVKYDWPGQNNGYANLNTAACLIYMRPGIDYCVYNSLRYTKDSLYIPFTIKNAGVLPTLGGAKVTFSFGFDKTTDTLIRYALEIPHLGEMEAVDTIFGLGLDSLQMTQRMFIKADLVTDSSRDKILTTNDKILKKFNLKQDQIVPVSIFPAPDTTILMTTFQIKLKFVTSDSLLPDSTQFIFDGQDLSDSCYLTSSYIRCTVRNLEFGPHQVSVRLLKQSGYIEKLNWSFTVSATGVEEDDQLESLRTWRLEAPIYPNPANHEIFIPIRSNGVRSMVISLYTIQGQKIMEQSMETANGIQHLKLNTDDLASGIYLVRIKDPDRTLIRKVTIIK